jgi:hypothetical protein
MNQALYAHMNNKRKMKKKKNKKDNPSKKKKKVAQLAQLVGSSVAIIPQHVHFSRKKKKKTLAKDLNNYITEKRHEY